jgi:protein gp37
MKTRSTRPGDAGKQPSTSELSVIDATALSTASPIEIVPAVDQEQLANLLEREARIDRAQRNAYLEIGLELKAIRDGKLYATARSEPVSRRYTFTTFEEYVEERWDITAQYANGIVRSAEAAEKLETIVSILPARESHVRELLKIENDGDRAKVWQSVVDRGETITAKIVTEEVQRFIAQQEKNWLTVTEWEACDKHERERLLAMASDTQFNKQDNASIDWAQWSWNPITGCKHDCPYCYARDIAKRFYPQGFDPSIYPCRFAAPKNTKVPQKADEDTAFKNVFTGSMADIFGRWVPAEWIELVIDAVRENSQWNFLFLTKFPQRVHEFGQMPDNAWMGTTVDCQERVANAEKAFAKMGGGIKWLSIEPMLTPLKFTRLELFDWVVIGGASRSAQTPAWVPPFDWIADLHAQARAAGCAVYHKDNLCLGDEVRLKEFPWEPRSDKELPDALKYLSMK